MILRSLIYPFPSPPTLVVFNKANRAQIKLITNYASSLLVKNLQAEEPDFSSRDAGKGEG